MDLNSGKQSEENSNITRSYTGKSYIDREEKTIEFIYRFYDDLHDLSSLRNTHIIVTKITGSDSRTKKSGQGFEQRKEGTYESVSGEWKLPIKSDQLEEYPTLKFIPTDKNLCNDVSAMVTPTTFIVDIKVSSGIGRGGNPNNMWLDAFSQSAEERKFKWRKARTYKKDNETYYRVIFDYPDYDSNSELRVHFPESNINFTLDK